MKKLDKLILKSFIGPFILTFLVAVFILLLVYMMKYFDDFIGKDLGFSVFAKLMGYFSINQIPMALPLAVLVSSLMTYGKLGEHFELTAIKGAGISLLRVILPTFVFTLCLAFGAFQLSNHVIPSANLRAFSLLYDIKQTKPALNLREGQFYSGIPKYSIKVNKKYPDGISMTDIVIYDHTSSDGNKKVIIADSCRMYSFKGDRYLKMDLYKGNYYLEGEKKKNKKGNKNTINDFTQTKFDNMNLVFSLASFDINSTDKELFADNRYMKGIKALNQSIDSMNRSMIDSEYKIFSIITSTYSLHMGGYLEPPVELVKQKALNDTLKYEKAQLAKDTVNNKIVEASSSDSKSTNGKGNLLIKEKKERRKFANGQIVTKYVKAKRTNPLIRKRREKDKIDTLFISSDSSLFRVKYTMDSLYETLGVRDQVLSRAVGSARTIKSSLSRSVTRMTSLKRSIDSHIVEKYKKYAQAFACIVMFLIGAPLGAIIKRGGLGFPVIISIFFFIIFYVLTSVGDKWAKSGVVDGFYAAWMANVVLLPIGIFFLKQAKKDAKIFDADFYNVGIDKLKTWWLNRKNKE